MIDEIRRILSSIRHIAVRGRLTLIDNAKSIQIQQNELFTGQTKSDIPAPQQYGFESAPLIGADTINLNRGGSLESGWSIMTYDGRYKPLDLADGDSIMYTKRDTSSVHRIKFSAESGEILVETDETVKVVCKTADIDVSENAIIDVGNDVDVTVGNNLTATVEKDASLTVENDATLNVTNNATAIVGQNLSVTSNISNITTTTSSTITCPLTTWNGNIVLNGNITQAGMIMSNGDHVAGSISLMTHVHGGVQSGPSLTSTPQ